MTALECILIIKMLKILYGPNSFTKNLELTKLKSEFSQKNGPMSIRILDAENLSSTNFLQELQATGLFTNSELLILKNSEDNLELISAILKNYSNQNSNPAKDVILSLEALDKRTSIYKDLQKQNGFQEFNQLSEPQLKSWLRQVCQKLNLNLSAELQTELISRSGQNQQTIWICLNQLALLPQSEISIQHLDIFQPQSNSENAFNLLSSALKKDYKSAAKTLAKLNSARQEPHQIIGLICSQVGSLTSVYFGQKAGKDSRTISSQLALHPFAVSENIRLLSQLKLSKSQIKNLFEEVRWLDSSLKTINKTEPWPMLDATLLKISTL